MVNEFGPCVSLLGHVPVLDFAANNTVKGSHQDTTKPSTFSCQSSYRITTHYRALQHPQRVFEREQLIKLAYPLALSSKRQETHMKPAAAKTEIDWFM